LGILPGAAGPLGTTAPPLLSGKTQGAATSCMVVVNFVKKEVQSAIFSSPPSIALLATFGQRSAQNSRGSQVLYSAATTC
jgi:hypothetical protein